MSAYSLVIGASSAIAHAIIQQEHKLHPEQQLICVSRSEGHYSQQAGIINVVCDYREGSITQLCEQLKPYAGQFDRVYICNGVLHDEKMTPEKKLEEVNADQLMQSFQTNTIIPMLWLSKLIKLLGGTKPTQVAVFSARVGSISDNRMGGWYSYRASKAALNMLIKSCAIEYARRAKNVKLIAFHPGTTASPLSKPFQTSVPENKLFSAEFVAQRLLMILQQVPMDNQVSYLDWDSQPIDW